MKNQKAFTIVELLTAVVILGVLSTLAIVGVGNVISNSHKRYNESQVKLLIAAAQTYYTDNKSLLPTLTFTQKKVTLQTLIDNNYIEPLVDYKKEPYDTQKSYAYVTRMAVGKYAYDGELVRKNGSSTKYKENANNNGKISITDNDVGSLLDNEVYTNDQKEILVEMEDPDTIAGYIITLYRGDKNVDDLEYKEVGNQTKVSTTVKLSKDKYPDGKYKLKVKLIDVYNNQKIVTTKNITLDTIAPKCSIVISDGKKGNNDWYTNKVELKMQVSNELGETVSCLEPTTNCYSSHTSNKNYSKTIVKTNHTNGVNVTYYGQVVDKANNVGNCDITFKQDAIEPKLELKKYTLDLNQKEIKDEMVNVPFFIKVGYEVGPSGVEKIIDTENRSSPLLMNTEESGKYYVGETINEDVYKIKTYKITNNAGITSESSIAIHKETEKPKVYLSNGTNKNIITITCEHPRILGNTKLEFDDIKLSYMMKGETTSHSINYKLTNNTSGNITYQFSASEGMVINFSGTCSIKPKNGAWDSQLLQSYYTNTDSEQSNTYYCYMTNHSDPKQDPNYVNCLIWSNCAYANKTCCKKFFPQYNCASNGE